MTVFELPRTKIGPWSLSGLKVAEFASEETTCFEAKLLEDGKPIAIVRNDGHGGCDMHHPVKDDQRAEMEAALARLEAFAKTLPPITAVAGYVPAEPLLHDIDTVVGELVEGTQMLQRMRRQAKTHALVWEPGCRPDEYVTIPLTQQHRKFSLADPKIREAILKGRPGATILNETVLDLGRLAEGRRRKRGR